MSLLLGAIADDFTGATDLANTLVKQGMRTVQAIGVPDPDFDVSGTDAIVVALKSRTTPADEAVAESLQALSWLQSHDVRQVFFKYCSTFDSTDAGNIGPVADALLDALESPFTIACPAFPTTGRTIFKGHLFVGDLLLSDSTMKDHPLTPMRDANLVNVLGRQTHHPVGLVARDTVASGADAVRARYAELAAAGSRFAIVDAVDDADLMVIGEASAGLALITGGSGVALGLPANFRRAGSLTDSSGARLPVSAGAACVLAGSCSAATREQIAHADAAWPRYQIDPRRIAGGHDVAAEALAWAAECDDRTPRLMFSSADPAAIAGIQAELGRDAAGEMVERTMARIAEGLVAAGCRRLIVAGGETSGAVVSALGVRGLRIGPEIDPGVPWCETLGPEPMALALKSGNFGGRDFFAKALSMLG
ncbi:MAG: 3-oxo-tetronate kinase [Pseudomonadota bacterium]